ncbi:lipoprotein [Campylobacterota bacterium]|nr:lipoprotein [Campylobacterota bacterium]
MLVGCGYKSASYYSNNAIGQSVFADVEISLSDPQSGYILVDAVREAVVSKFANHLAPRESAETTMKISSGRYNFSSIQKDNEGFSVMYRCTVNLTVFVSNDKLNNKRFTVSGTHDFSVEPTAVLSDSVRISAAREASLKALDVLISNIVVMGR